MTHLRIRILRWHGIEGAEETVAAEAMRLEIVPIRFLRQLGYEGAAETAVAAHYRGAALPSP